MVSDNPVLVVGAGLSGLSCCCTLNDAGIPYLLFDKSRRVGGRVVTMDHNGYKLDVGFQVLLTLYPEAQRFFDYDSLNLSPCYPGSMVWHDGRFHRLSDPLRRPLKSLASLFCPIGSFKDKIRIGMMRVGLLKTTRLKDGTSTIAALRKLGFGDSMIDRFWRPFMSGVFLENELSTSVRKFEESFRLFAKGHTTIPKLGIGELPKQMARRLDQNRLLLGQKISSVSKRKVTLESGDIFSGREVVLAVDGSERERMLGLENSTVWNSVECIYFGFPEKVLPSGEPILYLDGEGTGPINNLFFTSNLSDCAPKGKALASASVIISQGTNKEEDLVNAALTQLKKWFGASVDEWQFIKRFKIKEAIPMCIQPTIQELKTNGIYHCGDCNGLPSLDAALKSGRLVAEKIIEDRN
jgi:protoporphyrinogen oxidase